MQRLVPVLVLAIVVVACTVPLASIVAAQSGEEAGSAREYYGPVEQQAESQTSRGSRSSRRSSRATEARQALQEALGEGTPQGIIQAVAETVASTNIVVPNASAPRVLEGASSTESVAPAVSQSAAFIEQARSGTGDATGSAQQIVQDLKSNAPSNASFKSFIQNVVTSLSNTPQTLDVPSYPSGEEAGSSRTYYGPVSAEQKTRTRTPAPVSPAPSGEEAGSPRVNYGPVAQEPATTSGAEAQSTAREARSEARRSAEQLDQLERIGLNINAINTARKEVQKQVSAIVTKTVDKSVSDVATQAVKAPETPSTNAFSGEERQAKLAEIRASADARGRALADQIAQSVVTGAVQPQQVDPVLKSSLQDIAQLVQAESGVPVQVPVLGTRAVSAQIQTATENIQQNQNALAERDGLDLYRDTDHDGISDYDEAHLYHTDPNNAYTAGSNLTDGERILLGLDPHSTSAAVVAVESPKVSGATTDALFEVTAISYARPASTSTASTSSAPSATAVAPTTTAAPASNVAAAAAPIQFTGRALPNSFVTLYFFSTPIVVTVKTDENGHWSYTLDKPLEDGTHEMYVATVDDAGRILAKSPAIPFTKTAEALEYQPLTIQEAAGPSPLDILRQNFLVTTGVLFLIFALIGLLTVGFWRERTPGL